MKFFFVYFWVLRYFLPSLNIPSQQQLPTTAQVNWVSSDPQANHLFAPRTSTAWAHWLPGVLRETVPGIFATQTCRSARANVTLPVESPSNKQDANLHYLLLAPETSSAGVQIKIIFWHIDHRKCFSLHWDQYRIVIKRYLLNIIQCHIVFNFNDAHFILKPIQSVLIHSYIILYYATGMLCSVRLIKWINTFKMSISYINQTHYILLTKGATSISKWTLFQ